MDKQKVLFLCTGNSSRSQMAEAFLRHLGGEWFDAYSAGMEPRPIDPTTFNVMNEVGIDISQQTSKDVKQYLGKESFAYVITLCPRALRDCPHAFPGFAKYLDWSMEDPADFAGTPEQRLAKFRQVRDIIEQKVKAWLLEVK